MKQCDIKIRLILLLAISTALFNVHTDVSTSVYTWEVNEARAAIEVRDVGESVQQETMPGKIDVSSFASKETDVSFKFSYLAALLALLVVIGGSVRLSRFYSGKAVHRGISACLIVIFSSFMFLAPYTNIVPDTPEAYAAVPAVRAVGALVASGAGATVALPTHEADDILLVFAETMATESPGEGHTSFVDNGWAVVPDSPQSLQSGTAAQSTKISVYWKRATTSASANLVLQDAGDHIMAYAISFSGVITTGSPFDVTAAGGSGTGSGSFNITGDTTTVADTLVVIAVGTSKDAGETDTTFANWANSDLANVTELKDQTHAGASGGGVGVAAGEKATAGTYGNTSVDITQNGAGEDWAAMTIALKPPAAGGELSNDASVKIRGGTTIRGGVKFR